MEVIVLDTNVVLACFYFADLRCESVSQAIEQRRVRWLATAAMRAELEHVLDRGLDGRRAADPFEVLDRFDRHACLLEADAPPSTLICSDADDQKFIDLALAHGAPWLLTRDRALLKLRNRARALGVLVAPPDRWAPPPA